MEWTRSETIALALPACSYCCGSGLRLDRRSKYQPCNCVLRSIFRACYARFQQCSLEKRFSQVKLEYSPRANRRITWGRKDEEYCADFYLLSRKTLTPLEWKIFNYHFLLGADWKLCTRRLGLDRGNFFHSVYRIQEKLGRAYREVQPFSLFPLDEYFSGRTYNEVGPSPKGGPVTPRPESLSRRLSVPLLKAA
jgi:hypothetical protein